MVLTKEGLLNLETAWQSEENDSDEWYERGIKLYDDLMRVDHYNQLHYRKRKVDLLLEKARDEKMQKGNLLVAEKILKKIIDTEPNHPEVYYRLAFINAQFNKWEAALFYANETFEYGPSIDEEIKLSALMGYAYSKIGLKRRSKEQFEHAESLDREQEWALFINNYRELANTRDAISKREREVIDQNVDVALQKMRKNFCYILSVFSRTNYFITRDNQIRLSPKEAELLAFLIQQQGVPASTLKILNHVWPVSAHNTESTVVKRNISSLRSKLSIEFKGDIIPFVNKGYKLIIPVEVVIIKGVDFDRLSCY